MMKYYNEVGHTCAFTKRVAIPVSVYSASYLNDQNVCFFYNQGADDFRKNPWKTIVSIEHDKEEDTGVITFQDGTFKSVNAIRNIVVYVKEEDIESLTFKEEIYLQG